MVHLNEKGLDDVQLTLTWGKYGSKIVNEAGV